MTAPDPTNARARQRAGLACGLAAYGMWGVLPIYFKSVAAVSPVDIVAQRIVWSLLVLALLVTGLKGWSKFRTALADARVRATLLLTSTLIAVNWLLYVYAINSGHILAGSLGYYLNPLANILLGRFLLGERLGRLQWLAVAVAAAGVAVLAAGALDTLWLSLALCFSFAFYGLFRKRVAVDSITGLTVETVVLAPLALGWLAWGIAAGRAVAGPATPSLLLLLALSGIISTVPLLLFTEAARRLRYATVGMLQFIAPTLQFLLAVAVYGEPFTRAHAIAFGAIWTALALFVIGSRQGHDVPALAD